MPTTVEWDNSEQSVIRVTLVDGWSWEELQRAVEIVESMVAGRNVPVDVIVDLTEAEWSPSHWLLNATLRANLRRLALQARDHRGRIVVVGASAWVVSSFNLFRKLLGERVSRVALCSHLQEAYAWLRLPPDAPEPASPRPDPAEAA